MTSADTHAVQANTRDLLRDLIDHVGGPTALAYEMRVSEPCIRNWMRMGRVPPAPTRLMAVLLEMGDDGPFGDVWEAWGDTAEELEGVLLGRSS